MKKQIFRGGAGMLWAMLFVLPTLSGCGQSGNSAAVPPGNSITWNEANKYVGARTTVTGPVVGHRQDTGRAQAVLAVGKDYPDPKRFEIAVPDKIAGGLPADFYVGKTVAVTGTIKPRQEHAAIEVDDLSQIVVENAGAKPAGN
jgi:hypothetical protein